jgi:hypothetical protein
VDIPDSSVAKTATRARNVRNMLNINVFLKFVGAVTSCCYVVL